MKYKITAVTPESVINYMADEYERDGDYFTILYNHNKSIINLTKFVTIDIEGKDDES